MNMIRPFTRRLALLTTLVLLTAGFAQAAYGEPTGGALFYSKLI